MSEQQPISTRRTRAPNKTTQEQRALLMQKLAELDKREHAQAAKTSARLVNELSQLREVAHAAKLGALVTACDQAKNLIANAAPKQ
jgi:hypothetical protein